MTSSGIHQVAAAQKNKVKPFRNGIRSRMKLQLPPCRMSVDPASVVIATAPILIQ